MTYELISERRSVASKEHDCIWCTEKIEAGWNYIREISKYDGFQSHAWHPECKKAAEQYFSDSNESEFVAHACKRGTIDPA